MDSRAIINSNVVTLDEDEIKGAARFHKSRIAFGIINGEVQFNTDKKDDRDHQHWICGDYGLSVKEFENIVRGYMVEGEIYFYTSTSFDEISLEDLSLINLMKVLETYSKHYQTKNVNIYNGVEIGKVGERWPGKTLLLSLYV